MQVQSVEFRVESDETYVILSVAKNLALTEHCTAQSLGMEMSNMEKLVGHVTHYYTHLGVAAVEVEDDEIDVGDTIHIKGHTTDLVQPVESMEYEHHRVDEAEPGRNVGIKVREHVREHDAVYKVEE